MEQRKKRKSFRSILNIFKYFNFKSGEMTKIPFDFISLATNIFEYLISDEFWLNEGILFFSLKRKKYFRSILNIFKYFNQVF